MNSVNLDLWEQEFLDFINSKKDFPQPNEVKLIVCLNLYDYYVFSEKINTSENPIFKNIKAGREGNFIFDDAMAMLGFGPRTIRSALQSALTIYNDE